MNQQNRRGPGGGRGQDDSSRALVEFKEFISGASSFAELDQARLVEHFAEPLGRSLAGMSRSQMRSFFDTVREIQYQSSDKPDAVKVQIAYLLAKAEYKTAQSRVPRGFRDFIRLCGALVKNRKDLECFVSFFEAVYAYHYAAARS